MKSVTHFLLDSLIKHYGCASDYALAKALGYTQQRISRWRNHDRIGRDNALEFCEILWPGDDDKKAEIMLKWMAESEKNVQMKGIWERLASRATAATFAFAVPFALLGQIVSGSKYILC